MFTANDGDADAAFRSAAYTRREQFRVQRMTAMTMETRGLLAEWDAAAGRLSVSGAAKLPFFNRRAMAAMMKLPEAAVDYVEYDVGGGFGARGEFYPEDFLVAFAARNFGRPVKWVEDRREHFMAIAHSRETECDLEIALDRDGTILGLRGDIWVDIGAYVRPNGMTPVRNVAQFTSGPYRVPNLHLKSHAMVTNKTPSGTYRGPGRFEGCFFMDRLLDMAAKDLGLDRLEIRRRNLIALAEMPYPLAPVRPNDGFGDTACDSGDYAEHVRPLRRRRRLGRQGEAERQAGRRPLSRPRHRLLHRRRRLGARARMRASWSSTTARSRSMSDRRRSGRGSRPSWRRSPPTRSKCRSSG